MRLSTPCSRIRSSAGETSSSPWPASFLAAAGFDRSCPALAAASACRAPRNTAPARMEPPATRSRRRSIVNVSSDLRMRPPIRYERVSGSTLPPRHARTRGFRRRLALSLPTHTLRKPFASRLPIPLFVRLRRNLPLDEELRKLTSLSLALEWHAGHSGHRAPAEQAVDVLPATGSACVPWSLRHSL